MRFGGGGMGRWVSRVCLLVCLSACLLFICFFQSSLSDVCHFHVLDVSI